MNDTDKKLSKAEAGRLGGKIGGRRSRGGGRPKKYTTEDERRAARVRSQQEYRERLKQSTRPPVIVQAVAEMEGEDGD